ncbi:MAG TPA: hypothetical protein VE978_16785 [Chitinophagales bacterium]|nr:hypothetical protein [Chitinophagales bacterium]
MSLLESRASIYGITGNDAGTSVSELMTEDILLPEKRQSSAPVSIL